MKSTEDMMIRDHAKASDEETENEGVREDFDQRDATTFKTLDQCFPCFAFSWNNIFISEV